MNHFRQNHLELTKALIQQRVLESYSTPEFGLKTDCVLAALNSALTTGVFLTEPPLKGLQIDVLPLYRELQIILQRLHFERNRYLTFQQGLKIECVPYPIFQTTTPNIHPQTPVQQVGYSQLGSPKITQYSVEPIPNPNIPINIAQMPNLLNHK